MAAVALGGVLSCGPVDEVPPLDAEKQASIAQLVEMLSTSGAPQPTIDAVAERLDSLCRFPPASTASRALAQALVTTMSAKPIGRDTSERLTQQLYAVMNGGYLRRRQLEELTVAIERDLLQAGVPADAAAAVRAAGIRVAREPRDPRTDWW